MRYYGYCEARIFPPGMYAINVEPTSPHNRNNRKVHLDYLKHLKECVETVREVLEEARIEKLLDNALAYAYLYTKRSQELLEYVFGSCLKEFSPRDKKVATTPLTRKKQVTFKETCKTSGSKPKSNTKNNRTLPAKSDNKKKVEAQPRNNKSNLKQKNRVDSSIIKHPQKSQGSEIPLGVLLHSSYTQVTENDLKRDI
ncbi:hypothetical protein Tco_1144999 [Tanacetum coccineum]